MRWAGGWGLGWVTTAPIVAAAAACIEMLQHAGCCGSTLVLLQRRCQGSGQRNSLFLVWSLIMFLLSSLQVVMHDLASADSRDIPRSACFESKAPTALAFLLLNLPGLSGYGQAGGQGAARMQVGRAEHAEQGRAGLDGGDRWQRHAGCAVAVAVAGLMPHPAHALLLR